MDISKIREYLPHRFPILLVDRVVAIESGKRILAYKNISINESIFQGHFPHYPLMPGVLIVEALAQTAAVLGFYTMDKKPSDGSVYLLAGMDKVRFKRPVCPGDRLWLEVDFITEKRGIWKFKGCARVDEEIACTVTILCADREIA